MRADGGYSAVLRERGVRQLLVASLAGRLAFSMLPLGLVLFATSQTRSSATAGALVAAFSLTSALAPIRGRIVDRRGPTALVGFAAVCAGAIVALALAAAAPAPALVALGLVAGAAVPPLGPFTRAVWGAALPPEQLQRVFALDSAGEEAALIVAPLLVGLIVAAGHPALALSVAGAGLLAGTVASARCVLARRRPAPRETHAKSASRLPCALWLAIASLLGPGAALGALNVAVPAVAAPARAGLLLSALAIGTAAASLLAGRRDWRLPPASRLAAFELALAAALAAAAATGGRTGPLAAALLVAGATLGALFVTLYLLVDQLTPAGAGTRTFAWVVTANNGGLAFGAAAGGAAISMSEGATGLWLAAACALMGVVPAAAARAKS